MTRPFRVEADERRYFALRSEFLIRLVQAGVPTQSVHEIMRNFGKCEDMLFFEGVRQGMVAARLVAELDDGLPALTVHGLTYGNAETPLWRVEQKDGVDDHPWLDADPLEFAPSTLAEALEKYGPDLAVSGAPKRQREPVAFDPVTSPGMTDLMIPPESIPNRLAIKSPLDALDALADGMDPETVLAELAALGQAGVDGADSQPLERPALLDRIRDVLLKGHPVATWADLILLIQRELVPPMDAGYLDMMLSSPMGMTVVSQAGLFHLHPGAMATVTEDGVVVTR